MPLSGWSRAIVKHMAKMAAAVSAMLFRAGAEQAAVGVCAGGPLHSLPKAGPAGAAVKLVCAGINRLIAACTMKHAVAAFFVERAGPGAFGIRLAQNGVGGG